MKAREFSRLDRVAATIQRVLAGPLGEIARMRGAGLVTITHVDVSADMRRAAVFLSVYADDSDKRVFIREMATHASELQAVLARELRTRRTPVLAFRLDEGIERGDRINRLLADTASGSAPE